MNRSGQSIILLEFSSVNWPWGETFTGFPYEGKQVVPGQHDPDTCLHLPDTGPPAPQHHGLPEWPVEKRGQLAQKPPEVLKAMLWKFSSHLILFKALCSVFRGQLLCFRKKLFQNRPILFKKKKRNKRHTLI